MLFRSRPWASPGKSTGVGCLCLLWLLSLNLTNPSLPALNFSSAVSSALSALMAFKTVRALIWTRLRFKEILWLTYASAQTTKTVSISLMRLFFFLIIPVFTRDDTFNFLQEHFLCTHYLAGSRCLAFGPSWLLTYLPH